MNGATMIVPPKSARARWRPVSIASGGLMVVATATFMLASLVHSGVAIALGPVTIDDPFRGAAIPEGIIAVVLGIGSATVIALLATMFGLTVTLRTPRTGDITYHVAILVVLAVIVGLLLLPTGRRSVSGE